MSLAVVVLYLAYDRCIRPKRRHAIRDAQRSGNLRVAGIAARRAGAAFASSVDFARGFEAERLNHG